MQSTKLQCTTLHYTEIVFQACNHSAERNRGLQHCALFSAQCTLHIADWTLHTVHCTLYTAHCTLYCKAIYWIQCTSLYRHNFKHTPFNTVQAFLRHHLECRKNCHIMSTELNTKHSQLLNIIILNFFSPVLLNLQGNMFLYCPAVKAIQRINSSSIDLPGFVI